MTDSPPESAKPEDPFPDLTPLAAPLGQDAAAVPAAAEQPSPSSPTPAAHATPAADEDVSGIWASVVPRDAASEKKPAPHITGLATEGYHAQYVHTPPGPPPPAVDLNDLDPFAPTQNTLGSTVRRESRLELMDNSESDKEGSSPTDAAGLKLAQARQGHNRVPSGGFSFGNMFRSLNSTPSKDRPTSPSASDPPRGSPSPAPAPAAADPQGASTSSAGYATASSGPGQPGPSGLAKPLASIASVFRSSARPSPATSGEGTPQPGSSPPREKGGSFLTAIAGAAAAGKGKERAREPEKSEDFDEKRPEGAHAGRGRRKGRSDEPTFDFNRFLEQMRSRSADPIAKYLRSFLKEFSRRPPVSTTDQVRVINDFLDFIAGKMRTVDPWKSLLAVDWREDPERAEAEFDLALEAMEKLVMNRLWHLTFSPALDLSALPGNMSPSGDVERDDVLRQRIRLFSWIEPKHLDLPIPSRADASAPVTPEAGSPRVEQDAQMDSESSPVIAEGDEAAPPKPPKPAATASASLSSKGSRKQVKSFLNFAQSELCKMNQYKAPRDKLICVLNCCKVIFGLMRHVATGEEGADTFIPFLIYVVIKANPEHLVSNLQFIQRFRNPDKLSGEGGYYLSSLSAAISFIEGLDASSLSNISQDEFEVKVAEAVKQIASEEPPPPVPPREDKVPPAPVDGATATADLLQPSEAVSASLLSAGGAGPGADGEVASAIPQNVSFPQSVRESVLRGTENVERAMSKPLGAIARIFEQLEETANDLTGQQQQQGSPSSPSSGSMRVPPAPYPPTPGAQGHPHADGYVGPPTRPGVTKRRSYHGGPGLSPPHRPPLLPLPSSTGSLQHAAPPPDWAMYAAPETSDAAVLEEIDRQHEEARQAQLGTLESIFPDAEREVLEMVLLSNSGDMGKTIDSMLEMA